MTFAVIIIIVAIGIGVVLGMQNVKKQKELLTAGKIISRNKFYTQEEFLYCNITDFDGFCSSMSLAINDAGVCNSSGSYNSIVNYKGSKWTAQLVRHNKDDGPMYSVKFTSYDANKYDIPVNVLDMNVFLTAVEKTFLQFDPNTKFKERAVSFKGGGISGAIDNIGASVQRKKQEEIPPELLSIKFNQNNVR